MSRLVESPSDAFTFDLVAPGLPADARCVAGCDLPRDLAAEAWGRVAEEAWCRRYADGEVEYEDLANLAPPQRPAVRGRRQLRSVPQLPARDPLAEIEPATYVEALTGVEVPRHGTIRCPLPGHEDRTPSFHVYPDAERGWHCFGCGRGGTVYDLARELSGIRDRGEAFKELRRWTAERLTGRAAA